MSGSRESTIEQRDTEAERDTVEQQEPGGSAAPDEATEEDARSKNVWDEFYRSIEDDLTHDSPTRNTIGFFKRAGAKAAASGVLALILAIAAFLVGQLSSLSFLSTSGGVASTFISCWAGLYMTIYTGWLPDATDEDA